MRVNIEKFISEFGAVVEPDASVASYPGGRDFPAVKIVEHLPTGRTLAGGGCEGMGDLPPTREPTQPIEDKDIIFSFLLEENGKEVTIYQEPEHIFIYTYGVPNKKPELKYMGPILAKVIAMTTSWGEEVESLAALSAALTDAENRWTILEPDPYNLIAETITKMSRSYETHGFICVSAGPGMRSQSVYIFRTSGWECAVSFTRGIIQRLFIASPLCPQTGRCIACVKGVVNPP